MTVVAGPPGSGKSSRFPLSSFHIDCFNADDRAAELNLGSFHKIPAEIRAKVNLEFQQWILNHIRDRQSFAIETTLRSPITFEHARLAREHGFWTAMEYVMSGSVEECVRRITERSYRGGHSASERLVKEIYEKSTKNLLTALDFAESGIEIVRIYDNSEVGGDVKQVLTFRRGRHIRLCLRSPLTWIRSLEAQNSRSPPCERQCIPDRTRTTGHANGNNTLHPTTSHGHTFKSPQLSFPEPIVWSSKLRQPG